MRENRKPYKTIYEVENDISAIEQETRDFYNLSDNWYGDIYPDSIKERENHLKHIKSSSCYYMILEEIEEEFHKIAKEFLENQEENHDQ